MDIRIRDVPTELHIALRMTVTAKQERQRDVLLRIIEQYVKSAGVVPVPKVAPKQAAKK